MRWNETEKTSHRPESAPQLETRDAAMANFRLPLRLPEREYVLAERRGESLSPTSGRFERGRLGDWAEGEEFDELAIALAAEQAEMAARDAAAEAAAERESALMEAEDSRPTRTGSFGAEQTRRLRALKAKKEGATVLVGDEEDEGLPPPRRQLSEDAVEGVDWRGVDEGARLSLKIRTLKAVHGDKEGAKRAAALKAARTPRPPPEPPIAAPAPRPSSAVTEPTPAPSRGGGVDGAEEATVATKRSAVASTDRSGSFKNGGSFTRRGSMATQMERRGSVMPRAASASAARSSPRRNTRESNARASRESRDGFG